MKRIAVINLGWSLAKSPEEQAKDKEKVRQLLEKIGKGGWFNPSRNWYPLNLEVSSPRFELIFQAIQEDPEIGDLLRIEHKYEEHELASAPLLEWGPNNQAIEDDYYTLHFQKGRQMGIAPYTRDCPVCRAPLEQIRDLWVDPRRMGKRDLSLTYSFEVILSPRLAHRLQGAGFTGFMLRPVWDYRKPYRGDPPLYQLVVRSVLPPMAAPPTEFEQEQRCEVCGTESKFLKHTHWWGRFKYREETEIYYRAEVLERAADFNVTSERFGMLSASHPLVIISPRVYGWWKEGGVRGWEARPVYLVGEGLPA